MMVDLGRYAFPVLASYAVTIVLLGMLVALTLWRARQVRQALAKVERDA
jgi:heme exporter protein D